MIREIYAQKEMKDQLLKKKNEMKKIIYQDEASIHNIIKKIDEKIVDVKFNKDTNDIYSISVAKRPRTKKTVNVRDLLKVVERKYGPVVKQTVNLKITELHKEKFKNQPFELNVCSKRPAPEESKIEAIDVRKKKRIRRLIE
jgi:replicative DNA helicase